MMMLSTIKGCTLQKKRSSWCIILRMFKKKKPIYLIMSQVMDINHYIFSGSIVMISIHGSHRTCEKIGEQNVSLGNFGPDKISTWGAIMPRALWIELMMRISFFIRTKIMTIYISLPGSKRCSSLQTSKLC